MSVKRSEPSAAGLPRLHKALADAGIASRRQAEVWIAEGRVRVNGQVVHAPGTRVDPAADVVEVDGRVVATGLRQHVYLLLHKPRGVVTTASDPEGRPTVLDLVGARRRVYPVGRLDFDSEGLLLLTDDGDLTYRLTQARYRVEKEYHALVDCQPEPGEMARLERGVSLEDGPARAVRARLLRTGPVGAWVAVVLHEGRKREVRRMLLTLGCPVRRLVRVRMGPLDLGRLPVGRYRMLTPMEVAALRRAVGLSA